jgi:hypothetical protein
MESGRNKLDLMLYTWGMKQPIDIFIKVALQEPL